MATYRRLLPCFFFFVLEERLRGQAAELVELLAALLSAGLVPRHPKG